MVQTSEHFVYREQSDDKLVMVACYLRPSLVVVVGMAPLCTAMFSLSLFGVEGTMVGVVHVQINDQTIRPSLTLTDSTTIMETVDMMND